jgi:hypothetical protein
MVRGQAQNASGSPIAILDFIGARTIGITGTRPCATPSRLPLSVRQRHESPVSTNPRSPGSSVGKRMTKRLEVVCDDRYIDVATVLQKVRRLHRRPSTKSRWHSFRSVEWPALFQLIDVCGGIHRGISDYRAGDLKGSWRSLEIVMNDGLAIEDIMNWPTIVDEAIPASSEIPNKTDLDRDGCVHINSFIEACNVRTLERSLQRLRKRFKGGDLRMDLKRDEHLDLAELFDVVEQALCDRWFAELTGYRFSSDSYRLSIAMQHLPTRGLCWHRDIDWPAEPYTTTVIYSLEDAPRDRGGAFLYYNERTNQMRFKFRQRHEASILRNDVPRSKRILHAVSEFYGNDSSRQTMIIQCVRQVH